MIGLRLVLMTEGVENWLHLSCTKYVRAHLEGRPSFGGKYSLGVFLSADI